MSTAPQTLSSLAVLLVSGPDARTFLQGQLSADLTTLDPKRMLLASCNSPQGRVQAVMWLVERPDGIALLLARDVLEAVSTRLRRYVLRAKVSIDTNRLHVGLLEEVQRDAAQGDRRHELDGDTSVLTWSGHRHTLLLSPHPHADADPEREHAWHIDHVRAGLPQIYSATYERFVAQMLNLDLLDGISFTKGCYTGQEIIARTHYRGAIKRRMFRFRTNAAAVAPGTRILVGDQHAGDVVDCVTTPDGTELLAVVSLAQLHEPLRLETSDGSALERLTLPYHVDDVQT